MKELGQNSCCEGVVVHSLLRHVAIKQLVTSEVIHSKFHEKVQKLSLFRQSSLSICEPPLLFLEILKDFI